MLFDDLIRLDRREKAIISIGLWQKRPRHDITQTRRPFGWKKGCHLSSVTHESLCDGIRVAEFADEPGGREFLKEQTVNCALEVRRASCAECRLCGRMDNRTSSSCTPFKVPAP